MSRYHVCHINSSAGIGGGEQYLLQLAGHLAGEEFRFSFVLPEEGVFCDRLAERDLDYAVIPMHSKFRLRAWSEIRAFLETCSADLAHCHGARANWYGRIAARRAGCRTVFCTIHNSLRDYPYPSWRKKLYLSLDRITSGLVHQWIAVSEALGQDLIHYYGYPKSRIAVIPNGVDIRDLGSPGDPDRIVRELHLDTGFPVLLHAARMTRQKGHAYLLSALAGLKKRGRRMTCLLAGDGPLRAALEQRARQLGIGDRVKFLGFRSDLADLLRAADVFVLPSLSEGMPIGLLEAMAMGCAVVATRVSGVPEVVEDHVNGILVPPADASALARALDELLDDPDLRRRLAESAARTVRERYTADRMAQSVAGLYRRHLRAGGGTSF